MNAVVYMTAHMAPAPLRRLAGLRKKRFERGGPSGSTTLSAHESVRLDPLSTDEARERVIARWGDDLCGLLNAMTRGELAALATELATELAIELAIDSASGRARSHELRMALWQAGAALERGDHEVALALQPPPVVLGGHLVVQAEPRGLYPPSERWPRELPPPAIADPPPEEPDSVDELLAAADRAIGVRLGRRGRDKGAWGMRASLLLGIVERGLDEPDWRGDIEVKTVPVARQPDGLWRVVEDPAIAMAETDWTVASQVLARTKLQRTLWLARADVDDGDATIVSWYLLDWDPEISRLAGRYLHERPKGPAGTLMRGLYLHKRFFADAGLLATLNGLPWAAGGLPWATRARDGGSP